MLEVLVLKIEDPGCFWVIIKGCSHLQEYIEQEVDYQKLNSAMNDFYNSMCQDIEIKPLMLEEGQVCVVYCQELKCWCRAVIKSIVSSADHYLAECFLVDFAKYIPVKSKKPATKWDSAAIQYFQNILRATTQVEAKLCAVEEDTFEVYLYATIKNEKVCVNDDLVAKNFAYYVSPMGNKILNTLEKPRPSLNSVPCSSKLSPSLTLWPMLLQGKDCHRMENKAVKYKDSLKDSPKIMFEKKQQCLPLKHRNKCVETSVYWPTKRGITIYADPDVPAASGFSQKPNEKPLRLTEKKDCDDKNGCVKLLQFLNPDPLRADEISDLQQLQKVKLDTLQPGVVLRNRIEPCLTMDKSPLSADLKKVNVFLKPDS